MAGSGIASRTIASLEHAWAQGRDALTGRDVLVVDEAGMIGSRQMQRVLSAVQAAGAKVVLVGDPEQLQAIEAGAAFRALAETKGLAMVLEVAPDAAGLYRGDASRLRQILYNLISNAVKFTEAGTVSVTVARRRGRVRLSVTDTGIGIDKANIQRLFEKFEQADASTTRRFGGSGLGLAICRQLAEMMGGQIRARSSDGVGTTFQVSLPLERVGDAAQGSEALGPAEPSSSAADLRILAAEDNEINRLVLRALLAQVGFTPTIVADGRAALEAWEGGDWDLILMDVQMPRMDGPTATRFIRERELAQRRRRTPIVALTANAMTHQVSEYLAAGMDGFVAKPIEVGRLFAALEAALAMPAAPAERTDAA